MERIFVSYAREDRVAVVAAIPEFTRRQLDVLIDREQIEPGTSVPGGINKMIRSADAAVLFHSQAYNRKSWTTEEQDALLFRLVEHPDFRLAVVRLDQSELPPLLAHRVWTAPGGIGALADSFANALRERPPGAAITSAGAELPDWLQVLSDDDLERIARTIEMQIRTAPDARKVSLSTRKAGALDVYLAQPILRPLVDTLAFVIRMLEDVTFLRLRLREQIAQDQGMYEGPFMLQERRRMRQVEGYREELRATLDGMIDRVTLA